MNVLDKVLTDRAQSIQLQSANDYRAYRHVKAKQLAKSRRDLKIHTRPNKNNKSSWKPKTVSAEDIAQDARYAQVLVNNAERAWGAAMEMKAVQETKQGESGQIRRQVISKLNKAVKIVKELAKGMESGSDDEKLQVVGYQGLIEGTLRFEQHAWAKAIDSFSVARIVMQINSSSEVMKDVLTAHIDPALSYAVYQSKRTRLVDIPTLAKQVVANQPQVAQLVNKIDANVLEINSTKQDPSAQLGPVQWRSHSAKVANPDLASAIIAAQQKQQAMDKSKLSTFDTVLEGWQDALDLVRESIDELESGDNAHDESSQQQYIIQTFVTYNLLFVRIQRDLLLVDQLQRSASNKPAKSVSKKVEHDRDLVRIYDTILQSFNELRTLSGVAQDDELATSLESAELYFKAQRTRLIAHAYSLTDEVKALALYKLALDTINQASGVSADLPGPVVCLANLKELFQTLTQELTRQHGLAVLASSGSSSTGADDTTAVVDSLDKFALGTPQQVLGRLVDLNPKLKPAPVKPVYFDIAFNYIDYDEQEKQSALEQAPAAQPSHITTTSSSGSSEPDQPTQKKGLLSSLWGR